ncbi:MAG: ABC transporter ATP-binding protein [Candidatus Pacearchaeota archaeon]
MIELLEVTKKYKIPHEKRNSLFETLKGFILMSPLRYTELKALDNINLHINKGEFIGIIGKNGSGKSTLLKIMANIIKPDSGKVIINGKVVPFLELGLGYVGDLSAKENVYINGALLGIPQNEIKKRFNTIIDFAGLNEFIDTKLKNFSAGMQMRLAFSTAINAEGDIFIIDELLAVGDIEFQKKCINVFEEFKKNQKTIIFASHDLELIKKFCNRVIWLENGKIKMSGNAEDVVKEYELCK